MIDLGRRSFLKMIGLSSLILPFVKLFPPQEIQKPKEFKFRRNKPIWRHYNYLPPSTEPLVEGKIPTQRRLDSIERVFISADELNRGWIKRLERCA